MPTLQSRVGIEESLPRALRAHLRPLDGGERDYDELIELLGACRFALLGEASHGTVEFYRERIRLTQRLIVEKGITAVAVEADWPDAWRVNRYVRNLPPDADVAAACSGFRRFPSWMWRNTDVRDFVEWLRDYNSALGPSQKVGFYGIDLYSLFSSIQAVLVCLERVDPPAARRARAFYECFDHAQEDGRRYGYTTSLGLTPSCEDEAVQQLRAMNERLTHMSVTKGLEHDEAFFAQQNACLVRNAEEYYRTMFRGGVSSWNLRDNHMVETLLALERHLALDRTPARIAVWADNSHLGDASATEMNQRGEWNVGQLVRDRFGAEAMLVGFSTYRGWVTAATEWDEPPQRKRVRDGLTGSWEDIFHQVGVDRFLLSWRHDDALRQLLAVHKLQRAIGVIYRPDTERQSHYFMTRLADQFDAMIHIDETQALEPLDKGTVWRSGEVPETYPSGI